jgi:hypothetical protein
MCDILSDMYKQRKNERQNVNSLARLVFDNCFKTKMFLTN